MANLYVRIFIIIAGLALFGVSIYGVTLARVGLPLDSVLPSGEYASNFLGVRVRYYGSYLQTIYTNAELNQVAPIDWPTKVGTFANLSRDIRSFDPAHVYSDPSLVVSWAINFTAFNKEEYPLAFDPRPVNGQSVTSFVSSASVPFRPLECTASIQAFCKTVQGAFTRGSQLMLCLQSHIFDIFGQAALAKATAEGQAAAAAAAGQAAATAAAGAAAATQSAATAQAANQTAAALAFNATAANLTAQAAASQAAAAAAGAAAATSAASATAAVNCAQQVIQLVTIPLPPTATVVEVVAPFDPSVAGFYSAPFGDTSNTFVKLLSNGNFGDGHIFQRQTTSLLTTQSWAILNSVGVVQYTATATSARSLPPQTNWYTVAGKPAGIVLNVKNSITGLFPTALRSGFNASASAITTHDFQFKQMIGPSSQASLGYELFQKELNGKTAWSQVHLTFTPASTQQQHRVSCQDLTSTVPSSICGSISTGQSMPSGEICGTQTWWTGPCGTNGIDGPSIVALGGSRFQRLNFSKANAKRDACQCYYETPPGNTTTIPYTQFQPVSPNSPGGQGTFDAATTASCNPPTTDVTLQCVPKTCRGREACYQDMFNNDLPSCNSIDAFTSTGSGTSCLVQLLNATRTTECCREALRIHLSSFSCGTINNVLTTASSKAQICGKSLFYCTDTCGQIGVCQPNADPGLTTAQLCDNWALELQPCSLSFAVPTSVTGIAANACMTKIVSPSQLGGLERRSCCRNSIDRDRLTFGSCLGDYAGYWNGTFGVRRFEYAICGNESNTLGCGNYAGTTQQFQCMIANANTASIAAISARNACCGRILVRAAPTNQVTNDCNGDATALTCLTLPNGSPFGWAIPSQIIKCIRGAQQKLASKGTPYTLSPFCNNTLQMCTLFAEQDTFTGSQYTFPAGRSRSTAVYLPTTVGQNRTVACPWGYTGTQTRMCGDTGGGPEWLPVANGSCVLQKCPVSAFSATVPIPSIGAGSQFVLTLPWASCSGGLAQVSARCAVNMTDNSVYWVAPTAVCSHPQGTWLTSPMTTCDPTKSSLMGIVPFSVTNLPTQQALCVADPKCVALERNSKLTATTALTGDAILIFDYCTPMNESVNSTTASTLYSSPVDPFRAMCLLCNPTNPLACVNRYNGEPLPQCFYQLLWWYLYNPQGFGLLDRDKFVFETEALRSALTSSSGFVDFSTAVAAKQNIIKTTRMSFAVRGINDDAIAVEYILALRKRLDEWKQQGIPSIATGIIFDLFSQYIGVEQYIWVNCAIVAVPVAVVCLLFLWNPIAVLIVLICDAMLIVEVIGFVEWSGLRVNGVLALNVVIAIGLTMEFTAHMARAFIVADGDFKEIVGEKSWDEGQVRMKKAMRAMFIPISLGAATTLIGISPIAGARFPYFRQYYFLLYVLIVCFGWFNGVIVQPVLLSFFNPKAFPKAKLGARESVGSIEMEGGNTTLDAGEIAATSTAR